MRQKLFGLTLSCVLFLSPLSVGAQSGRIRPGEQWRDNHGHLIQAHGGGITFWKGMYYWFGEDRSRDNDPSKRSVACYSSRDLMHWRFCGKALALPDPEHLGSGWVLERPKVFVNTRTRKFVLYAHLDDAHYSFARVMVAVSDHIQGPYRYVKSYRPLGEESRDIGQFIDEDGSAYLIFESRPTHGFFIARLTGDFMNVEKTCFIPAPLEGGAMVRVRGTYYVVGSHMTGWEPNPNVYATAPALTGPWTEFHNLAPAAARNYGSQSTMLLKVVGTKATTVIFMADQWRPNALWDSRYFWMPLRIGDGGMHLPPPRPWSIDVTTGEATLSAADR